MEWFRLAAQQGHPKSSYNLAIGHLSGMKTNLEVYISHSITTFFVLLATKTQTKRNLSNNTSIFLRYQLRFIMIFQSFHSCKGTLRN